VNHFNVQYGPNFFVFLNTCFYFPGLPVSLAQNKFDENYDLKWGPSLTFLFRMLFSLLIVAAVCFAFPIVDNESALLGFTVLLGMVTWTAHGTSAPGE
jgi:hypothetical protein